MIVADGLGAALDPVSLLKKGNLLSQVKSTAGSFVPRLNISGGGATAQDQGYVDQLSPAAAPDSPELVGVGGGGGFPFGWLGLAAVAGVGFMLLKKRKRR